MSISHVAISDFAMNGPEFLLFYALVAAITLALSWTYLRRRDDAWIEPVPETPKTVDSYEIAYLRDGQVGLARTVTVALLERGYLQLDHPPAASPRSWLRARGLRISLGDNSPANLEPIEVTVRDWFEQPRDAAAFSGSELASRAASATLRYEESLQAQQLLESASHRCARERTLFCGGGLLLGVALFRVLQALPQGHPVGFLVLLCGVGLLALWWVCRPQRLSSRGEALLSDVRRHSGVIAIGSGSRLALATALFGAAALAGTELDLIREYLETVPASSSSGGGGGDGDGGGCGGCGGCGG